MLLFLTIVYDWGEVAYGFYFVVFRFSPLHGHGRVESANDDDEARLGRSCKWVARHFIHLGTRRIKLD